MAAAGDVFTAGSELHGNRRLVNQLTGMRADNVHAQHAIGGFIGKHLDESVCVPSGTSSPIGSKRKLTGSIPDPRRLQRILIGSG
jgi:hypothetical protein